MRPRGLREVTIAMALLNLTGLLMVDASGVDPTFSWAWVILMMTAGYGVLWFFWAGRNWARWLVQLTSVLAILNLWLLPSLSLTLQVVLVVEGALGAYLLYWLNTAPLRSFFGRNRVTAGA